MGNSQHHPDIKAAHSLPAVAVCEGDGYRGERRQEGDQGEDRLRPTPPQDVSGHHQLLRLRERRDDEPGTRGV